MLLVEPNDERRARLLKALRAVGVQVRGVAHIAEIERWPVNEVIVTPAASFTPFWIDVGASAVVVLADGPEEGAAACARGATTWVPQSCDGATLQRVIHVLEISRCDADGELQTTRIRQRRPHPASIDGE